MLYALEFDLRCAILKCVKLLKTLGIMHSSHNWNLNSLGSFRKSVTGFAAERSGIDNRAQEKFTVKRTVKYRAPKWTTVFAKNQANFSSFDEFEKNDSCSQLRTDPEFPTDYRYESSGATTFDYDEWQPPSSHAPLSKTEKLLFTSTDNEEENLDICTPKSGSSEFSSRPKYIGETQLNSRTDCSHTASPLAPFENKIEDVLPSQLLPTSQGQLDTKTCICNRPATRVYCLKCGHHCHGRVRKVCSLHRNRMDLMDIRQCWNCQSKDLWED
ncbi:unnamed protein product [Enterobius vermicularis]|uniref:Phorbol-ester/DAG-type domain-containing protein n=1 Tax=Enterobius vermicularis TaxID=51028 RepID=A0A0N4VJ79_ENTVE|nr:unnamed protein product [Enterobius vermicularis]